MFILEFDKRIFPSLSLCTIFFLGKCSVQVPIICLVYDGFF
jgi:hypothetical protein